MRSRLKSRSSGNCLKKGIRIGLFHDSQNKQPADPATPKRRRLTRRDLETPAKQAMDTAPGKQELSNQVRIKKEVKTERMLCKEGRKLTPFNMRTDGRFRLK